MNKIVMQLVALLSAALTVNASAGSDETALKKQVAERDAQLADLHAQLDAIGAPLTDDQKAQVQQAIDAAQAAQINTAVPAPAVVTVDASTSVVTDQGAAPVAAPAAPAAGDV